MKHFVNIINTFASRHVTSRHRGTTFPSPDDEIVNRFFE